MAKPVTQILERKLKNKSHLLFNIQKKHEEHPDIAKCAILIGAGCSFPTLPLGGGLIELCQMLSYMREEFPGDGIGVIKAFMRNPERSLLKKFIEEHAEKVSISFENFITKRELILKKDINEKKEEHLTKIRTVINDADWGDFEEAVFNDTKYGFWMNEYSESPRERQLLIEALVDHKSISGAYIILALLIEQGYFKNILTTNFDDFINDAVLTYTSTRPRFYVDDELSQYISVYSGKPNIIKLHGDYRYSNIKNTTEETLELSSRMEEKLRALLKDFHLIVIGYNGSDHSIMNTLQQVKSPDCELMWCGRDDSSVHWRVANLINNTVNSWFVKINSFDDLIKDFYLNLIKDPPDLVKDAKQRQEDLTKYVLRFSREIKNDSNTSEAEKKALGEKDIVWQLYNEALYEQDLNRRISLCNKLIELDETYERAYVLRGVTHEANKNHKDANFDFKKAIELNPQNPATYYNSGTSYLSLNDYDRALLAFNKAIELGFNEMQVYNNRGVAYLLKKKFDNAILDLDKAIELDSRVPNPYKHKAAVLFALGNFEEALILINISINLEKTYKDAYLLRMKINEQLGNTAEIEVDKLIVEELTKSRT